jgi:hypothetical protein
MARRRLALLVAAVLLAVAMLPSGAFGDADPASDMLLIQNVFYPYMPQVSQPLQRTLNAETAAAAKAKFPIKVALIASKIDLGAIPVLFAKPKEYANFLDREISFSGPQPLLVVMPQGAAVQGLNAAATAVGNALPKPASAVSNDLARLAIAAVPKLAAAAGHPIKAATAEPSSNAGGSSAGRSSGGGSSSTTVLVVLIVAAVAIAGAVIGIRRRRATVRRRAAARRRQRGRSDGSGAGRRPPSAPAPRRRPPSGRR